MPNTDNIATEIVESNSETCIKCLKCAETYAFPSGKDDYLAHLYLQHRLVIADVEDIATLEDYFAYWVKQFETHDLAEYCTTIYLDQLPDGTPAKNEKYYLLSDILPQDMELRRTLQQQRLARALELHQFELTDRNFSKECLYCRDVITGLRADYFEHLFAKHFLLVGKPENLVYVDELLDKLERNLNNLVCLFCEKIFKDRVTLKEHMRKKGHKRINPNIREYDKYFLCNYNKETATTKPKSKTTTQQQHRQHQQQTHRRRRPQVSLNSELEELETESVEFERRFARASIDADDDLTHDADWSDWQSQDENAEDTQQAFKCLYCEQLEIGYESLKAHLLSIHCVDFEQLIQKLNFYQRIKVVNYVRHQIGRLRCVSCELQFDEAALLLEHMEQESHCGIGEQQQWDKPMYFFPYDNNDGLLCVLDNDTNDDAVYESVVPIISEEKIVEINRDAERLSLENFEF